MGETTQEILGPSPAVIGLIKYPGGHLGEEDVGHSCNQLGSCPCIGPRTRNHWAHMRVYSYVKRQCLSSNPDSKWRKGNGGRA